MTRFADNLQPLWRRLRAVRTPPNAIKPGEIAGLFLAALLAAAIIGVSDDARAYAWSTTLPDGWYRFFGWLTQYGKSDWLLIPLGAVAILVSACDWRATPRRLSAAWREIGLLAAVAFFAIALPGLVTDLIKPLVGRFDPATFLLTRSLAHLPFRRSPSVAMRNTVFRPATPPPSARSRCSPCLSSAAGLCRSWSRVDWWLRAE